MATRRERVVLELEDRFTPGIARAAAGAALLNRELDSLSRDSVRTRRSVSDIDSTTDRFGRTASGTSREVDKLSGRMRIFADLAAVLGPALAPIGAVGVPAITGMAAQLGFAATAAGTAILAFQGVGDALKKLNAAALAPTQRNLAKAQIALEGLSPAARDFVAQIGHMLPELRGLRDVAAQGLFPGLTAGFTELETALPHVRDVIAAVSAELGTISVKAGASLASDRWTSFLDFVAQNAPSALYDMAKAADNTAHALASLWMATDPLNDDFSKWLVNATGAVDRWASSLSKTQGFADFVAYMEQTGPDVAHALGAIANAAIQIVQATAPLGGPVLKGIEALGNVVAAIADSDLGTPLFTAAAGLALFNRTMGITRAIGRTTFGGMIADELKASAGVRTLIGDFRALSRETQLNRIAPPMKGFIGPLTEAQAAGARLRQTLPALAKTSALLAGVGIASTGAADKIGLTNTASLALMGTLAGPWGAAVGGAVGLLIDASKAGAGFTDSMNKANIALRSTDTSQIESAINRLKQQRKDLTSTTGIGDFFGDVSRNLTHPKELLPGAATAVDKVDERLSNLKDHLQFTREQAQAQLLADGFSATASGIDSATASTLNFERELEKLNAVLTGRASLRDYEQAVDDFTERQKKRAKVLAEITAENDKYAANTARINREIADAQKKSDKGRVADLLSQRAQESQAHVQRIKDLKAEGDSLKNSLDIGTQAGRDTQAALDNIAATALKVAQTLDPIQRTEFLAGARTEYVKAAVAAGMTEDAAKKLADTVLGLSKIKGQPRIVIDASGAWHVIDETARRLERLTRKTRKINIQAQAANVNAALADVHGYAGGGWTGPGSKYQPAGIVHADEFVFSKEATRGNVAFLSELHRSMRGYDSGGLVQRFPQQTFAVSSGLSEGDMRRIASFVASMRPVYGDAHFYGDSSQWQRQVEMDKRAAAVGGLPA